jgi:putative transposase
MAERLHGAQTAFDKTLLSSNDPVLIFLAFGGSFWLMRGLRSAVARTCVTENTFKFIKGKLLSTPVVSLSVIHRQLNRLEAHTKEFSGSYQQIRRVKNSLSEDLLVLARSEKEFEETRELLFRHDAVYPNEVWQADHKTLDMFVWDSAHRAVKPVLTAVIDDYSRAIMGYYLDLDPPSAQRTAIALRQAIWQKDNPSWLVCGCPDRLYTDRGTDFRSNRIKQIAAELGFKRSKRRSRKPQGGGKIERFFETVNQLLMSELPGYTPEGATPNPPGMTIQQLQVLFEKWLISEYMHRVHSEIEETPFNKWNNHPLHPRLAPSLESLDVLLMTVPDSRTVRQDGIYIFKLRYEATEFCGLVGNEVTVRYDPRDISEVLVYLENTLVCRAKCPALGAQRPSLSEFMKIRNRYKRGLKQDIAAAVSFANAQEAAQRKLPDPPEQPVSVKSTTGAGKIRRYRVDE